MKSSADISSKALKKDTVVKGGKVPYKIVATISADSQGFTYHALAPAPENSGNKDVVVREHFMSLCSDRGADGITVNTAADIVSTVNDCLHGFEQASKLRMEIASKHPSVIDVLDCFEANGTFYYVVEFLDGETLEEYVKTRNHLEIEDAIGLLTPVIHAVEKFHASHSLHADITPRHMRFTTNGGRRILVLFNLYNSIHFREDGSKLWYVQPSACDDGYAAPEQYGEIEHFTPQTDIYSLAATLAFMITGRHMPDSRHLDEESLREFLPPTLPETYTGALLHALEPEISLRTPSASDFIAELGHRTPVRPSDERKSDSATVATRGARQAVGRRMIWMGILAIAALAIAVWISQALL